MEILAFLKADQEARAKDKEEEKLQRAKERKEDLENLLAMLRMTVEKEVRAATKVVEDKLELKEKVNRELYSKLNSLTKELEDLKQQQQLKQDFPEIPLPKVQDHHFPAQSIEESPGSQGNKKVIIEERLELCTGARKIIGFSPITPRMLEIQIQSFGAKNLEQAMMMEIKSYMKCEMRMLSSEIEQLNMVRIFPPAKENWTVLYVEFSSDKEVDLIFKHTKSMTRKDHRVIRWIPQQMFNRFTAIQSLAYSIRKDEGLKTRVKIGWTDFELSTRVPTSTVWHARMLPSNLPNIDMVLNSASPDSPPPGRPGRSDSPSSLLSEEGLTTN